MLVAVGVNGLDSLENGVFCELRNEAICKLLKNKDGTYFLDKN